MVYAVSYTIWIYDKDGNIQVTDTFVFQEDTLQNRLSTLDWLSHLDVRVTEPLVKFLKFELVPDNNRGVVIGDKNLTINVRYHTK